ncbi:MAG: hypothetical protein J3R72DRAFT_512758 [Linnemannia gamsii]|nr:MAG: hypothetical protein J3R72DRAFT_512758 [Linnemannia gamsii]
MDKSTTSASQQPLSSSLPEDEQPVATIAAPSTMIGAPNKSKTHGYSALAQGVTKQSKGRLNINGKAMRERFQRHMKANTETKGKAESTGFGVSEDDTKKGLYTVAHKLESMCTCYTRMDVLFGQRPNVTPLHEFSGAIVSAQEQGGCQESSTAHRRPRRPIVEDEEEEEEDGNEEDDEDEEEEEERDGNQAEGGVIDNIFGEDFDDLYDASADNQGNSTRGTRAYDGDSINDGADINTADDISELSISSPPVFRRQSKRQLTDTESQSSNKRSRVTDRRKKPPSLDPGSSPDMPRRSFLGSYEQSYMKRNTEAKKLELEEGRIELEKAKEAKRQDMETKRQDMEAEKLEFEKAKEAKRQDMDERRLKLEEKKLETETQREIFHLISAGLAKDLSLVSKVAFFNAVLKLIAPTSSSLNTAVP